MKLQKLLMSAVAGCCLLGVSGGVAMAEGCGDGVLEGETFDGSLVVTDERSFSIISSTVRGSIIVRDSDNVLLLKVGDEIRVVRSDGLEGDGVANVIANTVFAGNLVVVEYEVANVIEN